VSLIALREALQLQLCIFSTVLCRAEAEACAAPRCIWHRQLQEN
jgi:hypothetical protein